jgi:Flp pilus assembly protein TadG
MLRNLRTDDRGVTMVFVAVSMLALLAVAGLVVDGGNAYAARRQMQNAADAGALAGANALQEYKESTSGDFGGTIPDKPTNSIWLAARGAAVGNNAEQSNFTCVLVLYDTATGSENGAQACPQNTETIPSNAFGVRVTTERSEGTFFMRALGTSSYTARSGAAANLQRASVGNAPFLVCANAPGHSPASPLLLIPGGDITQATINPAAIGDEYDIWGNAIKNGGKDCGNPSSSFRGLVDPDGGPYEMPGWWETLTGNKNGQVLPNIANGCGVSDIKNIENVVDLNCEFGLPLCTHGQGNASKFEAWCVAIGRFRVSHVQNHDLKAIFVGGGTVLSGAGGGIPAPADAVVIHLSE